MNFILGYLTGIVTATLIFVVLAFFRAGIEKRVRIIETVLGNAGPKPTGAVFLPEDDSVEVRREFVSKRAARGQRTTLTDLKDED